MLAPEAPLPTPLAPDCDAAIETALTAALAPLPMATCHPDTIVRTVAWIVVDAGGAFRGTSRELHAALDASRRPFSPADGKLDMLVGMSDRGFGHRWSAIVPTLEAAGLVVGRKRRREPDGHEVRIWTIAFPVAVPVPAPAFGGGEARPTEDIPPTAQASVPPAVDGYFLGWFGGGRVTCRGSGLTTRDRVVLAHIAITLALEGTASGIAGGVEPTEIQLATIDRMRAAEAILAEMAGPEYRASLVGAPTDDPGRRSAMAGSTLAPPAAAGRAVAVVAALGLGTIALMIAGAILTH